MSTLASARMPRRLPPGCSRTVIVTGISAFITAPRAAQRSDFAARHGPRNSWRSITRPRGTPRRLQRKERESLLTHGAGYASATLRNAQSTCASMIGLNGSAGEFWKALSMNRLPQALRSFSATFHYPEWQQNDIEVLRDRKLAFPEAANSRIKAIRAVFKWAIRRKGPDGNALVLGNPARDIPYLRSNNPSGYHTWTLEEVRQFEERHPLGTKARLALALLLFTGQRRSDVTRLGRKHARDGKITFTQFKGRNRKPKRLVLPILPALQQVIDASPCGDLAFLVNDLGRPFTDAGFGNKFRDGATKRIFDIARRMAFVNQGRLLQQTMARQRIN